MRRSRLWGALILAIVGLVWVGQGVGLMPGTAMSGSSFWALVGAALVLVAIGVVVLERRRSAA